jgi:hypothetical protein
MKKMLVLLVVLGFAGVAQAITVLHYDFSDGSGSTVTDLSGQGNDGTLAGFTDTSAGVGQFGTVEGWVTGGGLSMVRDDVRSYVSTPLGIGTVTGDWTIEYRANADKNPGYAPAVASSHSVWSDGVLVGLYYAYNRTLVAGVGAGVNIGTSPYTLPGDQSDPSIHHIAMVYDSAIDTVECFVDGSSVATLSGIPSLSGIAGEVFQVGNAGWSAPAQWDGVMYGVAISNTKLAPEDFVIVPEPMTMTLLGLGGLGLIRRKR